ncbi:MAG: cation transporter [Synergistaceae bacterium]|nr:cation transporter [Synergistaceae bacterium]
MASREKDIIRVSIIGIIANVILAGFKFTVGLLSSSVAIMIDSLNNASDVLSSVITIAGTKLASKPADKFHPYGHGRVEYLSAAVISAIILYAGITALIESARKILNPLVPEYSPATLIVVASGIAVKILLGRYVSSQGRRLSSDALTDSGKDALMDAAISSATLLGAFVFILSGVNLEAWLGAFISTVIIKAGIDMFRETTSKILGERAESELTRAIKETICETEGVFGAYDLILTNYGPDMLMGSVHIEVPDEWTADKIDTVSREIMHRVAQRHHIILAAVGVYSHNSTDNEVMEIRSEITRAVMSQDYVLQIHGFYCDTQEKVIRFDIVIDFAAKDKEEVYRNVQARARELYPDYSITVQADSDYSD